MIFQNRTEAGKKIAIELLNDLAIERDVKEKNLTVLAIPRGGVVVGKELAQKLNCPLDVIITKKIGAPGNSELAIGAVGPGGEEVIDEELAERAGADEQYLKRQVVSVKRLVEEREKLLRKNREPLNLKDKMVIITDDGVATGVTMMAAIEVIRQHEPKKIIVAVPVIARDSLRKLGGLADAVIYLEAPELFFAVGQFYREFEQVSEEEVIELLKNEASPGTEDLGELSRTAGSASWRIR